MCEATCICHPWTPNLVSIPWATRSSVKSSWEDACSACIGSIHLWFFWDSSLSSPAIKKLRCCKSFPRIGRLYDLVIRRHEFLMALPVIILWNKHLWSYYETLGIFEELRIAHSNCTELYIKSMYSNFLAVVRTLCWLKQYHFTRILYSPECVQILTRHQWYSFIILDSGSSERW